MSQNVLFVHDGPLYFDNAQNEYLAVHYNNNIVDRYSFFSDQVTFLMRMKEVSSSEKKNYSIIDHPAFQFIEMPNFKSITSFYKKREAKNIIKKAVKNHDIIIVRLPSAAGTIAFRYAKKYNKPVLVESVACVFDALWNYNWKGKLMAHFKYYQNRQLMRQATHSIYVTNEFLQSRYPTNGKSIGCSDVLLKDYDENVLNQRLQKIENRDKKQPLVLGTVAALNVPYKGQADVIRAIGELKKQNFKVVYKLVGQGDPSRLKRAIRQAGVEDRVEIIGSLPHNEVFNFLDGVDVYIQPSRQEGLPRAMVEALSRGCFTTGANTAGIPELIDDDYVFEAGNIDEINSIIRMLDTQLLKQQATRNFKESKKYLGTSLDKKRKDFYREFLKDHNFALENV